MRIAFLCKRRYMSKDVILDRYARLYEIPYQLAKLGHTVDAYCLSYQGQEDLQQGDEASPGKLMWQSRSAGRLYLPGLARYPLALLQRLRTFAPDLLIGASDIPHAVLCSWLAGRLDVPYAIDLYDNFEGFGQARIPGFVSALRRSVRNADLVTTTSEPLKELVINGYRARGEVIAMPSAVDTELFHPLDRAACRKQLDLPPDAPIIGTAGGLYREKGIETLYRAWDILKQQREDMHLVLAGPSESGLPFPTGERVHYLGLIPHAQTCALFNSLDVGVICIPDTPFGRYSFPQKVYEMLACGTSLAVTGVGAMPTLFAETPSCLYKVDDAESLARTISMQLQPPTPNRVPIKNWAQSIGTIEPSMRRLAEQHRSKPRLSSKAP